ncbi:MAG: DUF1538 domain-containing protein [Sphingomonadales bacterium]|nr:DUF1538 domain-containing protein [Sphingomonadales bacterium]
MWSQVVALLREMGRNLRDLLPILFVIALFQLLVIREPMQELEHRVLGAIFSLVGLTLFVRGLGMSIFPLGEGMADWLARRGSLLLLLGFGFALGFGSTIAEPALSAIADQAAHALTSAEDTAVAYGKEARFSLTLRYTVAIAVGIAVAMGVLRVVKGWPITWFVVPGYLLAIMLALISQSAISAVAFDAGTAATSAINVPLMMALGVGLAAMIRGRNPLLDGFGVVALASLSPMIVVQLFSLIIG